MQKVKKFMNEALAEATTEMFFASQTKKGKAVLGAAAGFGALTGMTGNVYAASLNDMKTKLGDLLHNIYLLIIGLATGLAVVMLAVSLVQYITAGDPQAAKIAKDRAKRVIIGWVIILSLGTVANAVSDVVSGGNYTGPWN